MAPEIINEEAYSSKVKLRIIDTLYIKADIWSAGCCFLHMIIGQKPYHMANAIQVPYVNKYMNKIIK